MAARKTKWIAKAISKPGSLRRSLKVKGDKPIPRKKLVAASHKGGKIGRRARLALTLRRLSRKR